MRILWINPAGTEIFDADTRRILILARRADTELDVVSLPAGRPQHLDLRHAYEELVVADIVDLTYKASKTHDAVVIGCFYDVGLREAREVSGRAIVTAPCQSATAIASNLGNRFSAIGGWPAQMDSQDDRPAACISPRGARITPGLDAPVGHGRP